MVLILGLGSYPHGSGTVAATFFASGNGRTLAEGRMRSGRANERVVVTDMKSAAELHQPTLRALRRYKNVELVLGKHRKSDIRQARLIVRNPGVPDTSEFVRYAKKLHKPITNDVVIFLYTLRQRFDKYAVPVVGITGTRGKSTVTMLTGELLKAHLGASRVHVGGNIGQSPLLFLSQIKAGDVVVLELSSWMLRDMPSPALNVAVFTNLMLDHMNYYRSLGAYRRDKERIFIGQTPEDFAIVNKHDHMVRAMADRTKAHVISFGPKTRTGSSLRGKHNQYNIAAAVEVAQIFQVQPKTIQSVLHTFTGVPHRLELVRTYKGREFYNDTTATTPDATIAALRSFNKQVILIAGGNSKQLPLQALRREIHKRVKHLILLPGEVNNEFPQKFSTPQSLTNKSLTNKSLTNKSLTGQSRTVAAARTVAAVDSMRSAVRAAWQCSEPGDIILLSPGVTWLPLMNEFERGRQFVRAVARIQ